MNKRILLLRAFTGFAAIGILALPACSRHKNDNMNQQQTGPGTDWKMATLSARTFNISVNDLPAPDMNASVVNSPQVLMERPANALFYAPKGFVVNLFCDNVPSARTVCVAPNGDVFIGVSESNKIVVLRDADNDGYAEATFTWDEGNKLSRPYGMAIYQNGLYVANNSSVIRYDYTAGQVKASGEPAVLATYPGGDQHPYRSLALDTVNKKMYIGVGSTTNAGIESDQRYASIQRFNIDGSGGETYASGMRNPQALAICHASGTPVLWSAVNERDGLGNQLVPDYVTELTGASLFYGWPYVYLKPDYHDPRISDTNPQVAATKTPEVLLEAHSAPLGMMFYTGTQFPEEYRGDAFIALHGSWNRQDGTGYKVVRVRVSSAGHAEGGYEDFLKGWHVNEGSTGTPQVFGRPVSVAMARDGSMLITDDAGDAIWRLRWKGN